jgi:phosphoglycolate phosphatase
VKPCLIFDLDGTLVDSLPGIAGSLNRTLTAHGLPGHSEEKVRSFVGDGLRMLIQRGAGMAMDATQIDTLVSAFKQDYDLTWSSGTIVYPGIHNLLEELQKSGYPLAVLSNKTHDFTVAMVAKLFPNIQFTKVLGQQDGVRHKPHPAGAFLIAHTAGLEPEDCFLIGDSTIDLETANNAEMKAISVTWGYHDRAKLLKAGATVFADTPSQIPALLVG